MDGRVAEFKVSELLETRARVQDSGPPAYHKVICLPLALHQPPHWFVSVSVLLFDIFLHQKVS